jgi:hypothetical protein
MGRLGVASAREADHLQTDGGRFPQVWNEVSRRRNPANWLNGLHNRVKLTERSLLDVQFVAQGSCAGLAYEARGGSDF